MICAMGKPSDQAKKSLPVWLFTTRAEAEKAAREIRKNGERYRIHPRQISAGGQAVELYALVILGRPERPKK